MLGNMHISMRRVSSVYLLIVFLLFLTYGPSISLIGQFRVLEFILLLVFVFNYKKVALCVGDREAVCMLLFFAASAAYIFSDFINGADVNNTLKRSTTYAILALLIPVVRYIARDDIRIFRLLLLGYCFSGVMQYVFFSNYVANSDFSVNPWRLGIGASITIAATLLPLFSAKQYRIMPFVLLLLTLVHVAQEARSLAFVSLMSSVLVYVGYSRPSLPPLELSFKRILKIFLISGMVVSGSYYFFLGLADSGVLPDEFSEKIAYQTSNPYGLIAAARPETFAAMFGVTKKPLIGFGSTHIDSDVMNLYATIGAASYGINSDVIHGNIYDSEQNSGTPNHSHLFGAWVQAGVFAALCWIYILYLALKVLYKASQCSNPIAPLAIVVSIFVLWTVLFSPGPHRMDSAINISVLIYVVRLFDSLRGKFKPDVVCKI